MTFLCVYCGRREVNNTGSACSSCIQRSHSLVTRRCVAGHTVVVSPVKRFCNVPGCRQLLGRAVVEQLIIPEEAVR